MSASELNNICVLAIDDDLYIRELEIKLLEKMGVKNALTADSAQSALDLLNEGGDEVDVILLDLNMPFRSGITFLKTLRKSDNKQIANLPVIIVSAEESTSVEDQLTELDVNGFVEKPIKLELLQSEIIDALVND